MEVKNLFDITAYTETVERLNKLTPDGQRQWGKMQVAQMLAHCKEAFSVPLSDKSMNRLFLGRLLGWVVKNKMYNNSPWKKSLPTSPDFIIRDNRDFEMEKVALLESVHKFHTSGPGTIGKYPHPFFGNFSTEQWGKCMWKHLDHHLRQFGA